MLSSLVNSRFDAHLRCLAQCDLHDVRSLRLVILLVRIPFCGTAAGIIFIPAMFLFEAHQVIHSIILCVVLYMMSAFQETTVSSKNENMDGIKPFEVFCHRFFPSHQRAVATVY